MLAAFSQFRQLRVCDRRPKRLHVTTRKQIGNRVRSKGRGRSIGKGKDRNGPHNELKTNFAACVLADESEVREVSFGVGVYNN